MALQNRDWIFGLIVVAVIGGLATLSYLGPHPKPVLPNEFHQGVSRKTTRVDCLVCHDPEKGTIEKARLNIRHPQKWKDEKFHCIGCHKLQSSNQ